MRGGGRRGATDRRRSGDEQARGESGRATALPRLPEPVDCGFERGTRGRPAAPDQRADCAGQERRRNRRFHGAALRRICAVSAAVQRGDAAAVVRAGAAVRSGTRRAHLQPAAAARATRRATADCGPAAAGRAVAGGGFRTGAPMTVFILIAVVMAAVAVVWVLPPLLRRRSADG